jgi:glycosyltransferase involved in cell wall biosynthesis
MRVGVLTTSYPRAPGDHAGSFVAARVERLLSEGHEVEVLAAGAGAPLGTTREGRLSVTRLPAGFGAAPDLFAGAGAPEALEAGARGALWAAARFSAELASAARARAAGWSRVESHWLTPCALAALAGAPHLPHLATAHSGDVALLERVPLGRSLARLLANSRAELVFVSEALRARFAALAGRVVGNVAPLPEGIAAAVPRAPADGALRAALGLTAPTVLSVGRLVPIKGFDLLIRACAPRAGDPTALHLVLLGDGPERSRLARLAAGMGVDLRLPGFVSQARVAEWLRAADLYVQPSRSLPNGRTEGTPVATLEALAAGIPVVAAATGGLAELPSRGAAVRLVAVEDAASLGAMIRAHLAPHGRLSGRPCSVSGRRSIVTSV